MAKVRPIEKGFGKRVRTARLHLGLTQLKLSKMVGVSRVTIAMIEGGHQNALLWTALMLRKKIGVRL